VTVVAHLLSAQSLDGINAEFFARIAAASGARDPGVASPAPVMRTSPPRDTLKSRKKRRMNVMETYVIRALWDGEAGVWVAQCDDVPGLVAEAATPAELEAKLRTLVPELLDLNLPARAKNRPAEIVARFEYEARIGLAAA